MRLIALLFAVLFCIAPVRAEIADDPVALITAIYNSYQGDGEDPGFGDRYSLRLRTLLDADLKAQPDGDAGSIDWDVFVNGNNWELSDLHIALVERSDTRAKVRATFKNFKQPQNMLFDLVRESGSWVIDDVAATQPGHRWTMSKILTHAGDAFPDEKIEKKEETK